MFHKHDKPQISGSQEGKRLASYSKKDAVWDEHRSQSQDVESIYNSDVSFQRYAERVHECSTYLEYAQNVDAATGEMGLKLRKSSFCRVRHCPVCQWRRSLMWQAKFYEAIPEIADKHSKARWAFLTLTVKNCAIDDLSDTLTEMNKAWNKLIKRKDLRLIDGWIRTTEVTRNKKDNTAHPHFHVLLMLKPSYFKGANYLTKKKWITHWQTALKADYEPNIDIRTVKSKSAGTSLQDLLSSAVKETLKYSVKPSDMTDNPDWFLELTRQLFKKRFIASGGALKDILKPEDQVTEEDLLLAENGDEDADDDAEELIFKYRRDKRYYTRTTAEKAYYKLPKPL